MKLFKAKEVVEDKRETPPSSAITSVQIDETIQSALTTMMEKNYSQLPVIDGETVAGAITYNSIGAYLKVIDEPLIDETSVRVAMDSDPVFVKKDRDIFTMFDVLATKEFIFVGDNQDIKEIITRYDIFHFLKRKMDPFIKIGEIEMSLRMIFKNNINNMDEAIEDTFEGRAEHDSSYTIPDSLKMFSFAEYIMFLSRNISKLPSDIADEEEIIKNMLDEVRQIRNSIFHFRTDVDNIDQDMLDVAHEYFTSTADV